MQDFNESLTQIYNKLRIHFYMQIFNKFENRDATLTTVEAFSMECIMALGEPTIAEFARMMRISAPNAAYRVSSLMQKGYVVKIQSTEDQREHHLRPTEKYVTYYNINKSYLTTIDERCKERFTEEEYEQLNNYLKIISEELTPELNLNQFKKTGRNKRHVPPVNEQPFQ